VTESGPVSSSFSAAAGVFSAWEKWTNSHGGINGRPVQVIVMNDQGNPATGLAEANTLIHGDHVIALTEAGVGGVSWLPNAAKQGVPLVGSNDAMYTVVGRPDMFPVDTSLPAVFLLGVYAGEQLGGKKLGFAGDPAYGGTIEIPGWKFGAGVYGLTFGKGALASATAPSYIAPCLALKQAGVDTFISSYEASAYKQFIDQCAEQGYHLIVAGQTAQVAPFWLTDPAFAKSGGSLDGFPWFDTSEPAVATFNDAIKQYDPSALNVSPTNASEAWATMVVFGAAAAAAHLGDNPTYAQMIAGFDTITNNTFGGITPPLTYANGGNLHSTNCGYVINSSGGKLSVFNNGNPVCVPAAAVSQMSHIIFGTP
jgi:branched-chain amino acid transport system substrate-binding protein